MNVTLVNQDEVKELRIAYMIATSISSFFAFLFFIDPTIRTILTDIFSLIIAAFSLICAVIILVSILVSLKYQNNCFSNKIFSFSRTYLDVWFITITPTMLYAQAVLLMPKLFNTSIPETLAHNQVIAGVSAVSLLLYLVLLMAVNLGKTIATAGEKINVRKRLNYASLGIIIIVMIVLGIDQIWPIRILSGWYYFISLLIAASLLVTSICMQRKYTLVPNS